MANVTLSISAPSEQAVFALLQAQGWEAKRVKRLPEDNMVTGLILLMVFLLLLVCVYVVASHWANVSDTFFGIIGGSATQASTAHQAANAYRDSRVTYAQTGNFPAPAVTAAAPPPPPG